MLTTTDKMLDSLYEAIERIFLKYDIRVNKLHDEFGEIISDMKKFHPDERYKQYDKLIFFLEKLNKEIEHQKKDKEEKDAEVYREEKERTCNRIMLLRSLITSGA